jgi:hypothetical protein
MLDLTICVLHYCNSSYTVQPTKHCNITLLIYFLISSLSVATVALELHPVLCIDFSLCFPAVSCIYVILGKALLDKKGLTLKISLNSKLPVLQLHLNGRMSPL